MSVYRTIGPLVKILSVGFGMESTTKKVNVFIALNLFLIIKKLLFA